MNRAEPISRVYYVNPFRKNNIVIFVTELKLIGSESNHFYAYFKQILHCSEDFNCFKSLY